MTEARTETIAPDSRFHGALLRAGLRHVRSARVTGCRYGSGTFHNYHAEGVGYSARYREADGTPMRNRERDRMIAAVRRLFEGLGYSHVATKGRQGIHWFSLRDSRWDRDPGVSAKVGASMDTKHGYISVSIHDYRTEKETAT